MLIKPIKSLINLPILLLVIRHSACINSVDTNSCTSTETAVSHTLRYLLSTSIYEVEIISSTFIDRALIFKTLSQNHTTSN